MIGLADLDEISENFQGGGPFPIQKIMLQIFAVIFRENNDESKAVRSFSENSSKSANPIIPNEGVVRL